MYKFRYKKLDEYDVDNLIDKIEKLRLNIIYKKYKKLYIRNFIIQIILINYIIQKIS